MSTPVPPQPPDRSSPEQPRYTKYRSRPKLFGRGGDPGPDGGAPGAAKLPGPRRTGGRKPITKRRVAKWVATVLVGWIVLSLVLFLISAQIEQGKVADATNQALAGGGIPIGSPTTILVLGSDQRPKGTKEAGASTSGPSRSDSIMLMRVGGGVNRRLSIARDTLVNIPGHGQSKINAAYAYGGAPLAIKTIGGWLGVPINHIIEVSFSEFPDLIDAMGGINYKGSCVVGKINGGYKNGGVTVRIKAGQKKHLNGKQALALARIRENLCNPRENDLSRARRQQRIISAMRSRVIGPAGFARLPWISWQVPRTFKTDMSGPTLMAVFGNLALGGTPDTHVLGTLSGQVPDAKKQAAVRRFLHG